KLNHIRVKLNHIRIKLNRSGPSPTVSKASWPRPEQRQAPYYAQQRTAPKPRPAGAERSRAWAVQARSPDKVLHYSETTGGPAVPPAPPADKVLHYLETTGGHAGTAGGC
ncbi:MAG: hypothetical protein LBD24_05045, partial [Spirochaetaceae bacterium]|nr:hypothetical protein [Spirochaetaceae bacterium]